ncbi:MAG: sigma-70 family RNA polymerase sigma factor [Alphaproteobacteria bacterium]|nr:sigma-70 family RNA polymerase sigma factor [Alphaproteobacteria bacterium]
MGALARMPAEPDDRDLLLAAREGDEASLEAFCRRRFTWMRRIARLELGDPVRAEDAVQDALVQLVSHVGRWDPARPFEPWLAAIVRNCARMQRRRWRPWEPLVERFRGARTDRDLDLRRASSAALEAFDQLAPGQRHAVYHVDVLDMDVDEVARLLDITPSTVRVQLHRGRKNLRAQLEAWRTLLETP